MDAEVAGGRVTHARSSSAATTSAALIPVAATGAVPARTCCFERERVGEVDLHASMYASSVPHEEKMASTAAI